MITELITKIGKEITYNWISINNYYLRCKDLKKIYQIHPDYKKPINSKIEKEHIALWRTAFKNKFSLGTLRLSYHISGKANPNIVPKEIIYDIERCLNKRYERVRFLENKSFYNRWYPGKIFPKGYVYNIEGSFYDGNYKNINETEVNSILNNLDYPVCVKPAMESLGGANVFFPNNKNELRLIVNSKKNYVIQEKIVQNKYFAKYSNVGLNTLRVCLYRSVISNEMNILSTSLRMGKGGSLDNLTAGGMACYVHSDGHLDDIAIDIHGTKFDRHPDNNLKFSSDDKIPKYEDMKKIAINIAQDVYLARLLSLDLCFDSDNNWRVIEINLANQSIQFPQNAGFPFFGNYTQEVIEYCKKNPWWK